MAKIQVHIVPLLGLIGGVGAALFGPSGDATEKDITWAVRAQRVSGNFQAQWPLVIGLPLGASFAATIGRGAGNPKVTMGPVSVSAF